MPDSQAGDKPTASNTVAEIIAWLDAHAIDHSGVTLKADLLKLIGGGADG
ncbi:hypothetical protein L248_1693 [Schleiferilactobacillus shenzhenensis LY-73]|uniref:Uncharacterized protein n=1 Tax=Schleiferilactobacillus shenzhenensis LY-73 TaxID=1231336 RepID=U4TGX9_9LACO|nr:hypothetical protein L248_1693 [Schleiferilactobacillus shenzhenensis LY-73]